MIDPEVVARRTLALAERVSQVLTGLGVETAVIGALAVAAHGFPRQTRDLDLATDVDPFSTLREAAGALRRLGLRVELREPDPPDPLGGVVDVRAGGARLVQIVNFFNPLAGYRFGLGGEAIGAARAGGIPGSPLRVVGLPHLVALKLYAGGPKSRADVCELLARNPAANRDAIRDVCQRHGLAPDLERLLSDLG